MVNQASQGIMGSCCRRLEHIKWTLAISGMVVTARYRGHLDGTQNCFWEGSPARVGSILALLFFLCDICDPKGKDCEECWSSLIWSTAPGEIGPFLDVIAELSSYEQQTAWVHLRNHHDLESSLRSVPANRPLIGLVGVSTIPCLAP